MSTETETQNAGPAATTPPVTAKQEDDEIPDRLLRLVRRQVGKKMERVERADVLGWKEYADQVVVVTTDGQKLVGKKA
jgi:hypothetical protein